MLKIYTCTISAIMFAAMFSTTALAEGISSSTSRNGVFEADDWDVALGAGVFYSPVYEGSDESEFRPVPFLDVRWRDTLFLNPRDGLGVNLLQQRGFTFGTSVGYDFGRDESDSVDLRGLGDIDGSMVIHGHASYQFRPFSIDTRLTRAVGGSEGLTLDVGGSIRLPLSPLLGRGPIFGNSGDYEIWDGPMIIFGASSTWADDQYMSSYFGVSPQQATNSGLAGFDSASGFKSAGANAVLQIPLTEHILMGSRIEYSRLLGDAASSPVSRDNDQFSFGLFTAYRF